MQDTCTSNMSLLQWMVHKLHVDFQDTEQYGISDKKK